MDHVVWDWNGTLFADQHVVVDALNVVLDDAGLPPVELATYQRLYTRPVKTFYERLFQRPIAAQEWLRIDDLYHDAYRAALDRAHLTADAQEALGSVERADRTQSLLSMWRHDELVPLVDRFGLKDRFARIDGLRGGGGGAKAPHLAAHLQAVVAERQIDARRVLVIGDALDDAAAALHVGARCVLYDGGSHPRVQLEAAGVPVASTLTEALDLADGW